MQALLLAEGGTFDAQRLEDGQRILVERSSHGCCRLGREWQRCKNGVRLVDKNGALKYYSLGTDAKSWTGKSVIQSGMMLNSWRNPFHVMEAHRAVCYAIQERRA